MDRVVDSKSILPMKYRTMLMAHPCRGVPICATHYHDAVCSSDGGQAVHRVSRPPADALGDDRAESPAQGFLTHLREAAPVGCHHATDGTRENR